MGLSGEGGGGWGVRRGLSIREPYLTHWHI